MGTELSRVTPAAVDASIKLVKVGSIFVGNTVGQVIPYKCPHCGDISRLARYSGNPVDGYSECPTCKKNIFG